MINAIIWRNELYMARRTLVAGALGIVSVLALFGGLSGLVIDSDTGAMLMQLLANMPPALLEAFDFDAASLQSYESWMASEPHTFYILIVGIMAANGAAGAIAREIDQGTAEAVVSLPIRRRTLFLSKVASHLTVLTIIAAAGIVAAFIAGYATVGVQHPGQITAVLGSGWLIALAFAGVGYAISPFVDSERNASSLGAALVIGSFVLDILSTFSDKLAWIAKASLFSLFDVRAVVASGSIPAGPAAIAFALLALGIVVGVVGFERKDILV